MLSVEVLAVDSEHAVVRFDIGGRKRMTVNVSKELPSHRTGGYKNICVLNVSVDSVGPRGAEKGNGVSIAYGKFDVTRPILGPFGTAV